MARNFLTAINLNKNELQNPAAHNLAGAPSSPVKGQFYMNTTDNTLYYWDGSQWQSAKGGSVSFPGFGAVTASTTFGAAKNDGVGTTAARADHTHGTPTHVNADHAAINLSALAAPTTDLNIGGFKLVNVGTPVGATDGVNKSYVDNLTAGLSWKDAVRVATTANIALTGTQTIDGVAVVAGDRVLVKNQTAGQQNGIYVVAAGAWARTADADTATEMESASVFVMEGAQADTGWVMTTNAPITIDTTPLTWVQFSGSGAIIGGAGLVMTGSTLDVVAGNGSLVVNANDVVVGFAGSGANFGTAVTPARSDHTHTGLYTRSASANCLAATSTTVTHSFGTKNVAVEVYRNSSPWDTVDCDVERPDNNNVTVRFSVAPAAAEYVIVVVG